jgi:hypothetical protein
MTGGMIINMIRCETARLLLAKNHKPVILPSHQFVGNESAEEQLDKFYEGYRKSLKHLYE